jgi:hypothetical protein
MYFFLIISNIHEQKCDDWGESSSKFIAEMKQDIEKETNNLTKKILKKKKKTTLTQVKG